MTFSFAEQVLFAALLVASACAFWVRFRQVLRVIRAAKPDQDFRLAPLGRRVRDFVWEVLFQAKVIRQRPWAGLAHALVFWGFCVFAVVTLNHFGTVFGLPFLSRLGVLGKVYFSLAAAFAVLVVVSIAGLFVRRFVIRPKWLGPLSAESGVIALLIFVLMITYLGTFWAADSKPLWWAHSAALLIFLPLIPQTKHLHLVLSPASVFLSRGEFAHIPPLKG